MNSKLLVLLTNPDVADLCSELGLQARPEHVPCYVWDAYVKRCSQDVSYRWWDFRASHALDTLRYPPRFLSVSQMRSAGLTSPPVFSHVIFDYVPSTPHYCDSLSPWWSKGYLGSMRKMSGVS